MSNPLDSLDPAWAWAPYQPDARRPWNLPLAGHLYRRAGFGGDWPTLQQALADGPQRAVERVLRPEADVEAFNRRHDQLEMASIDVDSDSTQTLRQWWLRRMIQSPHPLLEKMTLFWHGHFGTSGGRAGSERLVQRYVQLLRRHALGSFAQLLEAASREPAVLANAQAKNNPKARPNEYFARVMLEFYALGPGVATESDLREAARAFTGCSVLRGEYRYLEREHDDGPKRVLGREGPLGGADVLKIALAQQAAPRWLVRKLFAWLVSETAQAPGSLTAPLEALLAKDYDVGRLLGVILRSNLFFSPAAYRQRVKSPLELALGIVRGLGGLVPTGPLGYQLSLMGQDLCEPPTVHGWEGGVLWLNRVTLVERSNMARALLADAGAYEGKLNPAETARKQGFGSPEGAVRFLLDLFVQGDVPAALSEKLADAARRGDDARLRQLAHVVVTLPEFQLA